MQPHLLILVDYYLPHRGGIEVSVEHHIHAALAADYRISVLTSKHTNALHHQETIQTPHGSYTVHRVGSGRWSYFWSGKKFLKYFMKQHHVDIIHCHTYAGALLGSWAKKCFNVTTLVTVHEVFHHLWYRMKCRWNARVYRALEWWIVTRSYDHIHTPSGFTKQMIVDHYEIDASSISSVHHDLDMSRDPHTIDSNLIHDRQMKLGPDRYKILYYGHAGASKGTMTLIQALEKFLPTHENTLFVANITASRGRNALISHIQDVLPPHQYHIETGMDREKLQALVMAADIVVIPSLSEGFGFVGAEVSALGKTAIVAHSGALPEIVSGDIHFFETENSKELSALLQNIYINNNQSHINTTYQSSGNVDRLIELYDRLRTHI